MRRRERGDEKRDGERRMRRRERRMRRRERGMKRRERGMRKRGTMRRERVNEEEGERGGAVSTLHMKMHKHCSGHV